MTRSCLGGILLLLVAGLGPAQNLGRTLPAPDLQDFANPGPTAWGRKARKVRKAVQRDDLGKALKEAEKLAGQDAALAGVRDAVSGLISGRLGLLHGAAEEGDYLGAALAAATLSVKLKGFPEGDEAARILKELKADPEKRKVMRAQKQVRRLGESRIRRRQDAAPVIARLKKIESQNSGNAASRDAAATIEHVLRRIESLR